MPAHCHDSKFVHNVQTSDIHKITSNEQSTSILCAINGKSITVWVSRISVLSYHGDDALCSCSQGGIDSSAGVVQLFCMTPVLQINQKLYDINTDLLTVDCSRHRLKNVAVHALSFQDDLLTFVERL